jgi:3-oxoacyl-[acyl-carrier protein] reductase
MSINSPERPLGGQVAIVTGAGRGLGAAAAVALARAGASVCCAARNLPQIERTAAAVREAGGQAIAVDCDVTDPDAVARMVDATVQALGGVDLLVANAGLGSSIAPLETTDSQDWKRTIDTNLFGTYLCARAVVPVMRARGGGKIITLGSGAGHRAAAGISAYACSKAATWMLTRILARELESDGINVNELLPGPVLTEMTAAKHEARVRHAPEVGTEWFKDPEDVMPMLIFMATQPPRGPTGQSFSVMRRDLW